MLAVPKISPTATPKGNHSGSGGPVISQNRSCYPKRDSRCFRHLLPQDTQRNECVCKPARDSLEICIYHQFTGKFVTGSRTSASLRQSAVEDDGAKKYFKKKKLRKAQWCRAFYEPYVHLCRSELFNSKTLIIPQGVILLWSWRARKKYIKLREQYNKQRVLL